MAIKISTGTGFSAYADAIIVRDHPRYREAREHETVLMAAMLYDRSLINLKAVTGNLEGWNNAIYFEDGRVIRLENMYGNREEVNKFSTTLTRVVSGYETIHQALTFRTNVFNRVFVVETDEELYAEFYAYCMKAFTFPLLEKWMPYLWQQAFAQGCATDDVKVIASDDYIIKRNGHDVQLNKLKGYFVELNERWIEEQITQGLKKHVISISDEYVNIPELFLTDMDAYFAMYGDSLVRRLKSTVKPYSELKGGCEEVLLCGHKRLWKQQGALVNGVANALADNHLHSAIINAGMGCGKTIMACAIIEEIFVKRWLRTHPGKTVKDCYSDPKAIGYRIPVMMPGHLVQKWKQEIEENIPYAKVTVCENLSDFTKIKAAGRARNGREFFVMSKDFAKLSCSERPAPVLVKTKKPVEFVCANPECEKVHSFGSWLEISSCKCGADKRTFKRRAVESARDIKGLICPDCGEVIVDKNREPLTPADFANKKTGNTKCLICGSGLWQPNVKNLGGASGNKRWYRIKHFKNAKKDSYENVWVLKGHEMDYKQRLNDIQLNSVEESKEMTVRKYAPAQYIKKQLKGYFDIAVFDEMHLYKGGDTAQGNAMHSIIKASKQCIGLTGTIAGGMANHLYYTLWRLSPAEMVAKGYTYTDEQKFVEMYGTLESTYELNQDRRYNTCSKGRQLESPKVRPGISPVIFQDFLIDKTVFMDLSDMSRHLPKLNEQVIKCDMSSEMSLAYERAISKLMAAGAGGFSALAPAMLQFSLAYPDKPYQTGPIIDPKNGREVCIPESLPHDDVLFPKEKALVEILDSELSSGRNCFIYCEYTGKENWRVVDRVRQIVIDYCGLEESEVAILEAEKPSPDKREKWIHTKAASGVRVFICNPRVVETGLDFIFNEKGKQYNFPTIIFLQMGMNLFTLWQASRRAYRLNQTEECRTYYLCYDGTNQAKMVRLMAEKQIATGAIQGHFSMEGLAAMSAAVDPRVQLMNNLLKAKGESNDDADEATRMFSQLSAATGIDESIYGPSETRLFGEVFDTPAKLDVPEDVIGEIFDSILSGGTTKELPKETTNEVTTKMVVPIINVFDVPENTEEKEDKNAEPVIDMFADFFSGTMIGFAGGKTPSDAPSEVKEDDAKKSSRRKKAIDSNQVNILDLFAQFE